MPFPILLDGPDTSITPIPSVTHSVPIPASSYQSKDLLLGLGAGITKVGVLFNAGALRKDPASIWEGGNYVYPFTHRQHLGNDDPLNLDSDGGLMAGSVHMLSFRRAQPFPALASSGSVNISTGSSHLINAVPISEGITAEGGIAFLTIGAIRALAGSFDPDHAPAVTFSGITSSDLGVWTEVGSAAPTAFHKIYRLDLPAGTDFFAGRDLATFTIGRNTYTTAPTLLCEYAITVIRHGTTATPWLRQRQRDDPLRVGGTAKNNPTSKQQSIRQGWRNTYL